MEWTIRTVKAELPDVKVSVSVNGKREIVKGNVRGRLLDFAQVHALNGLLSFEVSWFTVMDCLNDDLPIRYN